MTHNRVSQGVPDQAWKQFTEIGLFERHFNDLQSRYRALASTWLLATFAGIGFLLTKGARIPLGKSNTITLLATAGSVGITLLWAIDLRVYQNLLDAAFREGLNLERRYSNLPRVRMGMFRLTSNQGVPRRCGHFYIVSICCLLLVGGGVQVLKFGHHHAWAALAAGVVSLAVVVHVFVYLRRLTLGRSWRSYVVRATEDVPGSTEEVFSWLVEEKKVAQWAWPGPEKRNLEAKVPGAVGWGTEWIVQRETEGEENATKGKESGQKGEPGTRSVTHYDPPHKLIVRVDLDNMIRDYTYQLEEIGGGSDTSGSGTRIEVAKFPASKKAQTFLAVAEIFWIPFGCYLFRTLSKKARRDSEESLKELKNMVH